MPLGNGKVSSCTAAEGSFTSLTGLLEVEPLHFTCVSTSDGTRIERDDASTFTGIYLLLLYTLCSNKVIFMYLNISSNYVIFIAVMLSGNLFVGETFGGNINCSIFFAKSVHRFFSSLYPLRTLS